MPMNICESTEQSNLTTRPDLPIRLTQLYINSEWRDSVSGKTFAAIVPPTKAKIAQVAKGQLRM
ncbi:hypothetical protein K9N68_13855 [Kovacikia minuta CCNUW1]|uniref:hypothetical protein n=1 Tax=Kovacikia minuta TaxID=2931930 RepID=UPI001CCF1293|nr:hypothetical protein [Kovacikia minuta]UBF28826.1 hypothetical protein K9N68_13855 [Kovacikia minuta CCNUW1]